MRGCVIAVLVALALGDRESSHADSLDAAPAELALSPIDPRGKSGFEETRFAVEVTPASEGLDRPDVRLMANRTVMSAPSLKQNKTHSELVSKSMFELPRSTAQLIRERLASPQRPRLQSRQPKKVSCYGDVSLERESKDCGVSRLLQVQSTGTTGLLF